MKPRPFLFVVTLTNAFAVTGCSGDGDDDARSGDADAADDDDSRASPDGADTSGDGTAATDDSDADEHGEGDEYIDIVTEGGSFYLRLHNHEDPVSLNELWDMHVFIYTDAEWTQPAKDATLLVDATMPAHNHGMPTAPRVEAMGGGAFEVSGLQLQMEGDWEMTFTVTGGGKTETATWRYACCGPIH